MEARKFTYESIKPKLTLNNIPIKKESVAVTVPVVTPKTPASLTVNDFKALIKNCKKIDTDLSYDEDQVKIFDRIESELNILNQHAGDIVVEVTGTKTIFKSRNRILRSDNGFECYIQVVPKKNCKVILPAICNACDYVDINGTEQKLDFDNNDQPSFDIVSQDKYIKFKVLDSSNRRDSIDSE